jgi:hypothetical protein
MSTIEIIRTTGARETHEVPFKGPRLLGWVYEHIGCESIDAVNLKNGQIMAVDDNGWETETIDHGDGHIELKPVWARKPINLEATKIYQALWPAGVQHHQIAGDVAICWDKDFA